MNVPKLRFKEFDAPWIEKNLGKITDKVGSGSTPRGGEEIYRTEGIPFIRSQNVKEDRLTLDDMVCIPESVNNQMKGSIVQANDILLNITGASIGRSCVVPPNFTTGNVNQHVCIIRLKDGYLPRFVQPFISSERGQKSVMSFQVGSGREGLNFQAVRSFKISLPEPAEQTKIANFLTAVDEKITQLTQKHTLLTQYKKGVMQQIFSQELRFKDEDGRDFPEWKECQLGDLLEAVIGGGTPSRENPDYYNGTIPWVTVKDLSGVSYKSTTMEYITVSGLKNSASKIIPKNTLIISTRMGLGRGFINKVDMALNQDMKGLIVKNCLVDTAFLMQWYKYNAIVFEKLGIGSTVKGINLATLKSFELSTPSKPEQTKIAAFLTAIDDKLTHTKAQLTAVKQYKQGLLQQMFL